MKFTTNIKSERIDDDRIKLLDDFTFIDKRGVKWHAPKGFISDAASIPKWLIPIAGHPFDGNYLEASVIHDVYCISKSRSQKDTHRAFREALKLDGVSRWRRWAMFSAVRIYNRIKNPKWA